MRPILLTQMCHMTSLAAFTAGNIVFNWTVIGRMLESESLIRFTVWTGHFGVQVRIQKTRREGSIFSKRLASPKRVAYLRQRQQEQRSHLSSSGSTFFSSSFGLSARIGFSS